MYCSKCGNRIGEGDKFCKECGVTVGVSTKSVNPQPSVSQGLNQQSENSFSDTQKATNISRNISSQNNDLSNNVKPTTNKDYGRTSRIIGIVSIVLVFILQVFTIPLSIIGLFLGLKHKKATNQKSIGIVLNIISLVLAIPIFLFYSSWLLNPVNPVVGTWNCGTLENSTDYIITLKLNKNKTFIWNKYDDKESNYIKGEFEFKDLEKTNNSGEFSYYYINLNPNEYVNDGALQSNAYESQYEMGVASSLSEMHGQAVLMNVTTYNLYYCRLEK